MCNTITLGLQVTISNIFAEGNGGLLVTDRWFIEPFLLYIQGGELVD